MVTRDEIISEFHRRCAIVREAETLDLLDHDDAQRMKDRYRDDADRELATLVEEGVRCEQQP